jgi:ParB-like chromosome segregation protein Spo0J
MAQAPNMRIRQVPVGDLKPYERNARQHSPRQISQLQKMIQQFGWTMPILIDADRNILAGHGRLEAAIGLGMPKVPCLTAAGWTPEMCRAYIIADNKVAQNSTWDQETLTAELTVLKEWKIDLGDLGFESVELKRLFGEYVPKDENTGIGTDRLLVIVEVETEEAQGALFDELQARGLNVKVMS